METDCLEIVNLYKIRHYSLSVMAPLLLEMRELVSSFSFFDIQHVNRSSNVSVHLCAKFACTLTTENWTDSRPSFLLTSLLANDARSSFVE
ncbi:hypothetical protein ZWY2020_058588 [Hordeum vulgare]|uniref:RNase H type-1 domain-containing protein n=1 Tax=Hordeum vulgare subsp. vulgare TaxID=112509 RepID=A0A8I6X3E9_HORVV|nr:hypothetical protein ZWY2020_058588 [Hordeum vulgare]